MSEETQVNAPEVQEERPGYISIETGSTKHPDAKDSDDGRVTATIGVYVGETLADAVEKYGEEFVRSQYIRSVTVTSQGKVRRELDNGVPVATVEAEFDDLDPTETRTSVQDPQAQAMKAFAKMSEEERAEFLALYGQQ